MKTGDIAPKEEGYGSERECLRCYHCGEKRSSKEELREHIYSKQNGGDIGSGTGEKPFKCHLCNYKTSRRFRFKEHFYTHTGEKPYKCDVCEFSAARERCLKIHAQITLQLYEMRQLNKSIFQWN
ncbi:hypothetical protein J437_LFUL019052 [Ladona fulva]|uniref:C2H2-type domain-containing protein n=1 Tax=Ladona fulva TaxID=123851 RepID=A0A8K0KU36_LADFU|nr:hypothetical protein J437_LFUL019052 [Ladona fulva]